MRTHSPIFIVMIEAGHGAGHPSFALYSEEIAQARVKELNADSVKRDLKLRWTYVQAPLITKPAATLEGDWI